MLQGSTRIEKTDTRLDSPSQAEDRAGEGLGSFITKAHLFWYVVAQQSIRTAGSWRGTKSQNAGKILDNAKTVADYSIEEKGFIVCMLGKVRQINCFDG